MRETRNIKGTVLSTLVWQGLILKPNTEFNFSITREQYDKLKNEVIRFSSDFDFADEEIVIEENPIEDVATDIIEKIITEEEIQLADPIMAENDIDIEEDKVVEELLAKREEIEQFKEKEREIAYERAQVNKARPIPSSIGNKRGKK